MAAGRVTRWEALLARALRVLDTTIGAGMPADQWSFGGGIVLMRRFRHRVSKDVDIFLADPRWLRYFSPRLNAALGCESADYVEQAGSVKLYVPEGEIDFIAAPPLTWAPATLERIAGRDVPVESTAEIVAKKVMYRAAAFTARDLFDLALVATREPAALLRIRDVLAARRKVLLERLARNDLQLREDFAALDVLEFRPSYDECVERVLSALAQMAILRTHRAEQERAVYCMRPAAGDQPQAEVKTLNRIVRVAARLNPIIRLRSMRSGSTLANLPS